MTPNRLCWGKKLNYGHDSIVIIITIDNLCINSLGVFASSQGCENIARNLIGKNIEGCSCQR